MSIRPAGTPPLPTPSEMALLVAEAGLTLNAGQMADLALAWRQLVGLVARIPRDRPLLDDQAYVFRLPPPGSAAAMAPVPRPAAPPKAMPAQAQAVGAAAKPAGAAKSRNVAKPQQPTAKHPVQTGPKTEPKTGQKSETMAASRKQARRA